MGSRSHVSAIAICAGQFLLGIALDAVDVLALPDHYAVVQIGIVERGVCSCGPDDKLLGVGVCGHRHVGVQDRLIVECRSSPLEFLWVPEELVHPLRVQAQLLVPWDLAAEVAVDRCLGDVSGVQVEMAIVGVSARSCPVECECLSIRCHGVCVQGQGVQHGTSSCLQRLRRRIDRSPYELGMFSTQSWLELCWNLLGE